MRSGATNRRSKAGPPRAPCKTPTQLQAQRASVTPAEISRYEDYNERHGAKYVPVGGQGDAGMDEEDW